MSGEENEEGEGIHLITETLVTVIMVMVYITTGPLLRRLKIKFVHESGITMITAILLTLIAKQFHPESNFFKGFQFNNVFFFTFVLPLMIFSAGYNLRRDLFFKNFRYIAIFSISGTFITFFIISFFTYIANKHQFFYFTSLTNNTISTNTTIYVNSTMTNGTESEIENINKVPIDFSLWEILLFSAALSATDTVSSASLFSEESEPKLLSISYGDGIINDAICIALFKIVSHYNQQVDSEFTADIGWEMFCKSVILFIFSFILGLIIGALSSSFLKKMKPFHLNRVQEISILLLFAFISYILTDWIHLSPIVSLLSCGIFMSHYTFYNLCFQSREESSSISRVLDVLASAFAFSFLGLTTVYFTTQAFSVSFIIFGIIMIFVGRFCAVFVQIWILKLFCADSFNLKTSKKCILTFSGTIRGAVSFALAISISSPNEINREVLISSVIYIVFITTVILGGFMPIIFKGLKMIDSESSSMLLSDSSSELGTEENLYTFMHPNFKVDIVKSKKEKKSIDELKTQVSYWLGHYWVEFDDVCIKPKLISNWPEVKEDSDNLTRLIKIALHKYSAKKNMMTIDTDNLFKTPENKALKVEMNDLSKSQVKMDTSGGGLLQEKLLFNSSSEKSDNNSSSHHN